MSSVPAGFTPSRSGVATAILFGLAAVAVTAFWVFALFVIVPYLLG